MDSIADRTRLIHELVDVAARDLATYQGAEADPNRRAAGMAALGSIDAAARELQTLRTALANELYGYHRPDPAGGWIGTAGNSGPGF